MAENNEDMIVLDNEEISKYIVEETGIPKDTVDKMLFAYDKYLVKIGAISEEDYNQANNIVDTDYTEV